MTYTQVVLSRPGETRDSYVCRAAWIPSKFAKVGKVVRLFDEVDQWWTVTMAGKYPLRDAFVQARRDDYRYQRRVSDV